mgnify:CR=1 FL=1
MSDEKLFEIRFPAKPERLCLVRDLVKKTADVVGCCPELSDKLVIAVNEACMNVIQHAYQDDELGEIVVEMLNNDGQVRFRIMDYANPVDLKSVIRPGGLGTHFINEIMDECDRGHLDEGKGNYLEMVKKIS